MNNLVQCIDCGRWRLEDDGPHMSDNVKAAWGDQIGYDCLGRPITAWARTEEHFAKLEFARSQPTVIECRVPHLERRHGFEL